MITGLGFGLEDTGLCLEHAVLEPIPDVYIYYTHTKNFALVVTLWTCYDVL